MHEMSIALNVVEIACQQATAAGADRVEEIMLEVGDLAGVMIDSLEFCFPAASKSTAAENAVLHIDRIQGRAKCRECGAVFPAENFITLCPACQGFQVEVLQGRELRVKSILVND